MTWEASHYPGRRLQVLPMNGYRCWDATAARLYNDITAQALPGVACPISKLPGIMRNRKEVEELSHRDDFCRLMMISEATTTQKRSPSHIH